MASNTRHLPVLSKSSFHLGMYTCRGGVSISVLGSSVLISAASGSEVVLDFDLLVRV